MQIDVNGKVVVLTGTFRRPRQELAAALVALGARVTDSISAKTQLLFAGEKAGSKLARAKTLGLTIYGEEELLALLAGAMVANEGPAVSTAWTDWSAVVTDPMAHARALVMGDWSGFVAARDLEPLRALLARAEQAVVADVDRGPGERVRALLDRAEHPSGISDVHRTAGARLRERGAQLVHPFAHFTAIGSVALSNDGRHLATGSWIGDDYALGGTMVVWELASGRCVHDYAIPGGVGWPDFARCVQWSPDDLSIGVNVNTNVVAAFDAFGERPTERAAADVTDGWSRPPGFVWAPDGVRALIACWGGDSRIPGAVVRLDRGTTHESAARRFKGTHARLVGDGNSIGYGASPCWSAEDLLIFVAQGFMYAVRERDGEVAWVRDVAGKVSWCADRRHFIVVCGDEVVYHRCADGERVASGRSGLRDGEVRHGGIGAQGRFLVFPAAEYQRKRRGVEVWQGDGRLLALDLALCAGHYTQPDLQPVALSPDGRRLAVLTEDHGLQVLDIADPAAPICKVGPFEGGMGVFYGAHDTVVVVGPESIVFVDVDKGAIRGGFRLLDEAAGDRPLELGTQDLAGLFRRDPSFTLQCGGERVWGVGFPEGVVVCPTSQRKQVDELLALVVERRYAWPLRWSDVPLAASVADGALLLKGPEARPLRKFFPVPKAAARAKGAGTAKRVAEWPPAERGTLDDLFAEVVAAMIPLHSGWEGNVAESMRRVAETCALLGRADLVERALAAIPAGYYGYELAAATGRCAAIIARRDPERARMWLGRAAQVAAAPQPNEHDFSKLCVHCGLGAAREALADPRAGEDFAAAYSLLVNEVNAGQHIAELAGALALAGRVDDAGALIATHFRSNFGWHFTIRAVDMLLRYGGAAAWVQTATAVRANGQRISESSLPDAIVRELGARGEWSEGFAALELIDGAWLEPARHALVRGLARANHVDAALARAEGFADAAKLHPRDRAQWLAVMTAIAPAGLRVRVQQAARAADVGDPVTTHALAGALVRAGERGDACALISGAQGLARVEAAVGAVLAAPAELAFATQVLAQVPLEPVLDERAARAWARLSGAARLAGAVEPAQALLAAAVDGLKDAANRRSVLEGVLAALIEVGDVAGGRELLARFPRASRHRPGRTLAEGCALHGHYLAAAELLRSLPSADMNDRPQAAYTCFMNAAYREQFGPGTRWSW